MSLDALPEELLLKVAQWTAAAIYFDHDWRTAVADHSIAIHFEDHGLAELASVNGIFRRVCTPLLFTHLRVRAELTSVSPYVDESSLKPLLCAIRARPHLASHVKTFLMVDDDKGIRLKKCCYTLSQVLESLPNVNRLPGIWSLFACSHAFVETAVAHVHLRTVEVPSFELLNLPKDHPVLQKMYCPEYSDWSHADSVKASMVLGVSVGSVSFNLTLQNAAHLLDISLSRVHKLRVVVRTDIDSRLGIPRCLQDLTHALSAVDVQLLPCVEFTAKRFPGSYIGQLNAEPNPFPLLDHPYFTPSTVSVLEYMCSPRMPSTLSQLRADKLKSWADTFTITQLTIVPHGSSVSSLINGLAFSLPNLEGLNVEHSQRALIVRYSELLEFASSDKIDFQNLRSISFGVVFTEETDDPAEFPSYADQLAVALKRNIQTLAEESIKEAAFGGGRHHGLLI